MAERPRQAPVDYATLAELLSALAYAARLELLDQLRFPHAIGEVRLSPRRLQPGENPERVAARQTIQAHLEKLVEADLVRAEVQGEEGRGAQRYVVNPQKLYALVEEMRRLSTMYAGRGTAGDATGTLSAAAPPEPARGPRLVLVHGVYEGKAFALDAPAATAGRWVIGRRRGLAVTLDYDPYVSLENAYLTERGGHYAITDLPESKNGTSVNWVPLARGGTRPLKAGDVVGVGRSLLNFVPE